MTPPPFPPSRNAAENQIKARAGYVEFIEFADERGGYFCGTCAAFRAQPEGQDGVCAGLKVPVRSYGCCNNWRVGPREGWIGADGEWL